jgi:hypothetical protein
VDNLNNVKRETSRHFRNKKRKYMKDRIDKLATNSKNKNIRDMYRGINVFKRSYQPRSNLLKNEDGDLLAYSHNILNRWKNCFSRLLNVHRVTEPLVPNISPFEIEIAIAKLKTYKSRSSDGIPAELIQAGGEILRSKIHKLIYSILDKEEFPDQWNESIIIPVHKKGGKIDCSNISGISLLFSYKMLSHTLPSRLSPYPNGIFGIISVGFDVTDQLLIRSFTFVKYWRKNESIIRQYISYL